MSKAKCHTFEVRLNPNKPAHAAAWQYLRAHPERSYSEHVAEAIGLLARREEADAYPTCEQVHGWINEAVREALGRVIGEGGALRVGGCSAGDAAASADAGCSALHSAPSADSALTSSDAVPFPNRADELNTDDFDLSMAFMDGL